MMHLEAVLSRGNSEYGDLTALMRPEGVRLTYSELYWQAQYVQNELRRLKVEAKDRVILLLPPGIEFAACLVCVASSAVCVPLNPALSDRELIQVLRLLDAKALITVPSFSPTVRTITRDTSLVVIELNPSSCSSPTLFSLHADSCDVSSKGQSPLHLNHAVILATSGSTSDPKFVPQTHESLLSGAGDLVKWFDLQPRDRALNCMPLFHGNGLYVGFLPVLMSGGSMICLDSFSPTEFFRYFRTHDPTWFTTIPTYLQALLREGENFSENLVPHSLRFIRAGSAYLAPDVMRAAEKFFSVPVIAGYGSAEAVHITNNPLPPFTRKAGSVGQPCGQEVKVVSSEGMSVPVGSIGEVMVKGMAITTGYLSDEESNEELFCDGWLRTGDEGYFDDEGFLTLVGRTKQIINRGGESISPFEVEAAILSHPLVREAAVFAVPHPTLGENVAAAVVFRSDASVSTLDLQSYLFSRLLPQKIPYRILNLEKLPTSETGKVKYPALLQMFHSEDESAIVHPETEVQQILIKIWREVLRRDQIGITEHFLDLGGDSIAALYIVQSINREFGLVLQINDVLNAPTVQDQEITVLLAMGKKMPQQKFDQPLLRLLRQLEERGPLGRNRIFPLTSQERKQLYSSFKTVITDEEISHAIPIRSSIDPLPLSFSEEGLWLISQVEPGNFQYIESVSLKIQGSLELNILKKSLQWIVERHEILRTSFPDHNEDPFRSISQSTNVDVECVELGVSETDSFEKRIKKFQEVIDRQFQQPFDVKAFPLYRAKLFQLGRDMYIFVILFHHILMDEWSTELFLDELFEIYSANLEGREANLPDLPIQYSDYAIWQRQRFSSQQFESGLKFWKERLSNKLPVLGLPVRRPDAFVLSSRGAVAFEYSASDLVPAIRNLAKAHKVTQFVILETAFKILLFSYSSSTIIQIGTPVANRPSAVLQDMLGCFVNLLVMRSDLSGNPTFRELLQREREVCYAAYAHQEIPFQNIVAELNPWRDGRKIPLVHALFGVQGHSSPMKSIEGLQIERLVLHNSHAKFDLTFTVIPQIDGHMRFKAEYSVELFDEDFILQMLKTYEMILATIIRDPSIRLLDFML